jgi:hypothetical protein
VEDIFVGPPQDIGEVPTERGPGCKRRAALGSSEEANTAGVIQDGLEVRLGAVFGFEECLGKSKEFDLRMSAPGTRKDNSVINQCSRRKILCGIF